MTDLIDWYSLTTYCTRAEARERLQRAYDARGASRCGCGLARGHGPCEFAPATTRRVEPPTGNREAESLALLGASLTPATVPPPPAEHTPATFASPPCAPDVDG